MASTMATESSRTGSDRALNRRHPACQSRPTGAARGGERTSIDASQLSAGPAGTLLVGRPETRVRQRGGAAYPARILGGKGRKSIARSIYGAWGKTPTDESRP